MGGTKGSDRARKLQSFIQKETIILERIELAWRESDCMIYDAPVGRDICDFTV